MYEHNLIVLYQYLQYHHFKFDNSVFAHWQLLQKYEQYASKYN